MPRTRRRKVGRGHIWVLWDVDHNAMSRTTSTILPPPSDFPVPMPELAPAEPDSGTWRALVEVTKDTVRPGMRRDGVASSVP
jgi:hypothetical protein